jgi:hypothetical protein
MTWTDETEEEERRQKVLVMRIDPTTGATAVTEEQEMPRAQLTGNPAKRRFMERKWCEKLWRAMLRVQKRKHLDAARAAERAAKRQCKKDEGQMEALLAKDDEWSAHVFDP